MHSFSTLPSTRIRGQIKGVILKVADRPAWERWVRSDALVDRPVHALALVAVGVLEATAATGRDRAALWPKLPELLAAGPTRWRKPQFSRGLTCNAGGRPRWSPFRTRTCLMVTGPRV